MMRNDASFSYKRQHFKRQPHDMVKQTQTIRRLWGRRLQG